MEHEKGKRLLPSGLDDQAKLLRNGVVVVVAIDHVSVGPREMPERLVAGLLNQLNVGPLLGQRHQLILGGGVDRQNPSTCGVSPRQQKPGQVPRVCPDLDDGPGAGDAQASGDQLPVVDQRGSPLAGIAGERARRMKCPRKFAPLQGAHRSIGAQVQPNPLHGAPEV